MFVGSVGAIGKRKCILSDSFTLVVVSSYLLIFILCIAMTVRTMQKMFLKVHCISTFVCTLSKKE